MMICTGTSALPMIYGNSETSTAPMEYLIASFKLASLPTYMCLITASPNSLHFTSVAPSIKRAKS